MCSSDHGVYLDSNAAIKIAKEEDRAPVRYGSQDKGKLDTMRTLNFFEAHDEYVWPDFSALGFDFAQTMRLRRALVNDVFAALMKSGIIVVGEVTPGIGTPDSVIGARRAAGHGEPLYHTAYRQFLLTTQVLALVSVSARETRLTARMMARRHLRIAVPIPICSALTCTV
jgi:hypothetical protein